jgi:hypothetical protein
MTKGQNSKKGSKKKPLKTLKEKRQAKKEKKDEKKKSYSKKIVVLCLYFVLRTLALPTGATVTYPKRHATRNTLWDNSNL